MWNMITDFYKEQNQFLLYEKLKYVLHQLNSFIFADMLSTDHVNFHGSY